MAHDSEPTAERLWDDVSGRLREALNETTYATWFGDVAAGELLTIRSRSRSPTTSPASGSRGTSSAS